MILKLPDAIFQDKDYQLKDLQIDVALLLYKRGKISLARAASWLGINRLEFQKLLAERKIPINYSIDGFNQDLESLDSMPH